MSRRALRELVALHEAAHSVLAVVRGVPLVAAHVEPDADGWGGCFLMLEAVEPHVRAVVAIAGDVAIELAEPGGAARLSRARPAVRPSVDSSIELPTTQREAAGALSAVELARALGEQVTTAPTDEELIAEAFTLSGPPLANAYRELAAEAADVLRELWSAVEWVAEELVVVGAVEGKRVEQVVSEVRAGRRYRGRLLPADVRARVSLLPVRPARVCR